MNDNAEVLKQLTEWSIRVDNLRSQLILSSPLEKEREEYLDLVEKIKFIMEELIIYEEDEY